MSKLTGTFYFKRTSNGNLLGEFTNDKSPEIRIETAFPEMQTTDYEGTYKSVWFDTEPHESRLTIKKVGVKYSLEWTELNKRGYTGEGFIVDDILIGYYE